MSAATYILIVLLLAALLAVFLLYRSRRPARAKLPSLSTSDGRKAWSFLALMGASFVFTLFAIWAIYHVRAHAGLTFWLGIAAHVQLGLVIAVFGAQFVKRTIKAGRDGVEISDHAGEPIQSGDTVKIETMEKPE